MYTQYSIRRTFMFGTFLSESELVSIFVNVLFQLPEATGAVRMISQGAGNMLLVGTIRNCILQGSKDVQFATAAEVSMTLTVCVHDVVIVYKSMLVWLIQYLHKCQGFLSQVEEMAFMVNWEII